MTISTGFNVPPLSLSGNSAASLPGLLPSTANSGVSGATSSDAFNQSQDGQEGAGGQTLIAALVAVIELLAAELGSGSLAQRGIPPLGSAGNQHHPSTRGHAVQPAGGAGATVRHGGSGSSTHGSGAAGAAASPGTGPTASGANVPGAKVVDGVPIVMRDGKPIGAAISQQFDAMVKAAKADGVNLQVESGFRSHSQQVALWNANPNPALVARPGTSNHETGTAIDYKNNPGAFGWLKQNATRFGFHNYPPEPWHYSLSGQ